MFGAWPSESRAALENMSRVTTHVGILVRSATHTDTNHSKMFINSPPLISQVFPSILKKSREIRTLFTFFNLTSINFSKKTLIPYFEQF